MQHGHLVVDNFFEEAAELRAAFDAHFRNVHKQQAVEHQVWNYWYVPETYTFLRTHSERIVPKDLIVRFVQRVNAWSTANLGLITRIRPWLSLYIDGCGMTLHNDASVGQMAYVFSLTKWDTRNFLGGETILVRPENYWQTKRIKQLAVETFSDKIPAKFNRLLVFDDRIVHGVAPIQGTMDPMAGRVVLQGQLMADGIIRNGTLPQEGAMQVLSPLLERIAVLTRQYAELLHGFVTLRMFVQADGRVASVQDVCDHVVPLSADASPHGVFKQQVTELLASARFAASEATTELTVPILVGA